MQMHKNFNVQKKREVSFPGPEFANWKPAGQNCPQT
jgi:hypothetical protein